MSVKSILTRGERTLGRAASNHKFITCASGVSRTPLAPRPLTRLMAADSAGGSGGGGGRSSAAVTQSQSKPKTGKPKLDLNPPKVPNNQSMHMYNSYEKSPGNQGLLPRRQAPEQLALRRVEDDCCAPQLRRVRRARG